MRRRARQVGKLVFLPPKHPQPPQGGWTLLEAAQALCPNEARLLDQGGAELQAALRAEFGVWFEYMPLGWEDRWFATRLLSALTRRADLQITGRDLKQGLHAPRCRIPNDLLAASMREHDQTLRSPRVALQITFASDELWVSYDFPERSLVAGFDGPDDSYPSSDCLIAVRVESVAGAEAAAALLDQRTPAESTDSVRPAYNAARCRAWFRLRVDGWPDGTPPPSTDDCLAAARAYFAGDIARDAFRAIRRQIVPPSWQKPGPRRPRD